jgi:hypothetical protein
MTTENRARAERIAALRDYLEKERVNYLGAMEIINDPARTREFLTSLVEKISAVRAFNAYEHPAQAAVAEVVRMQERTAGVMEDLDFLDEYEEKKAQYDELVQAAFGKGTRDGQPEDPNEG